MKTLLIFAALLTLSCNPCKRMVRLAERNPQCLTMTTDTLIVNDTFIVHDTIITPEIINNYVITTDTIIETKTFYFEKKGNQYTTICKGDTIYRTKTEIRHIKVPYNRYVIAEKPKVMWWMWLLIGGFIVGIINGIKK